MMHGQWNSAWCGDWMGQSGYMGGGPTSFLGSGWTLLILGFMFMVAVGLLLWFASTRTSSSASPAMGTGQGSFATDPHVAVPSDNAESIVRERYARGEIDQAEYERLLGGLRR
jgi:putative membrane protein